MLDLVIQNALLVDGRGAAPVRGGIPVRKGTIAAAGPDIGPAQPP